MEVNPCPYIDMSIGNLRETPLKEIIARGMKNPWLGDHRPDCLIGEDQHFIKWHTEKTKDAKTLPIPWGQGFSESDELPRRQRYRCLQPVIDYAEIHARISRELGTMPFEDFRRRAEAIRAKHDGVGVPFFLPKRPLPYIYDLGASMQHLYLPAVGRSFEAEFPGQTFTNYAGDLGEYFAHELARCLVGWYFPHGEGVMAGSLETCAAFIGSPGLLMREDAYPPLLWLGTLSDPLVGYCFEAYGQNLTFNRRSHLGKTSEYWLTGGVVF
jgi:hypothetical protein